jgi:hypothetical protein
VITPLKAICCRTNLGLEHRSRLHDIQRRRQCSCDTSCNHSTHSSFMGKRLSLIRKVVFRQLCLHGFVKRELDGGKGNLMRTILGVSEVG